jgi:hypothetical protein
MNAHNGDLKVPSCPQSSTVRIVLPGSLLDIYDQWLVSVILEADASRVWMLMVVSVVGIRIPIIVPVPMVPILIAIHRMIPSPGIA